MILEAHCGACSAAVTVAPTALTITMPPGTVAPGRGRFACPRCGQLTWVALSRPQAEMLVRHGSRLSPEARARLAHPSARPGRLAPPTRPSGPPLTHDDLLDLHLLLQRDDWFDRLLALVP